MWVSFCRFSPNSEWQKPGADCRYDNNPGPMDNHLGHLCRHFDHELFHVSPTCRRADLEDEDFIPDLFGRSRIARARRLQIGTLPDALETPVEATLAFHQIGGKWQIVMMISKIWATKQSSLSNRKPRISPHFNHFLLLKRTWQKKCKREARRMKRTVVSFWPYSCCLIT